MNELADLTAPEIEQQTSEGAILLLPVGAMEQHGPHLPTRTDSHIAEEILRRAAKSASVASPLVLAPCLWLGASDHHTERFALSVSEETYARVAIELLSSAYRSGLRRVFILNGHGGNGAALRIALSRIRALLPDLTVAAGEYWAAAKEELKQLRDGQAGSAGHAGEIETSLMMYLWNDKLQPPGGSGSVSRLPPCFAADLLEGGPFSISTPWEDFTRDGVIGDPSLASIQKGETMVSVIVEAVSKCLESFASYCTARGKQQDSGVEEW